MVQWNASGKRLVMLWMRQIALNRLAHNNESVKQSALSDRLNVTLMIFTGGSALTAVINLISTILPDNLNWLIVMFSCFVIAMSIVATVIAGILQILKPDEKAEKNRQASVQYNNLSNIMQKESVIDDPKPLGQFLEEIIDRFGYIQNYGSEVMQDQVSTADLPNLVLIKDAERRRRMQAKMGGKSTPSPSNSPTRHALKIIGEHDHALFDASDYSVSAESPVPLARSKLNTKSTPSKNDNVTSSERESPIITSASGSAGEIDDNMYIDTDDDEEEDLESDEIEADILNAAKFYTNATDEVAIQMEEPTSVVSPPPFKRVVTFLKSRKDMNRSQSSEEKKPQPVSQLGSTHGKIKLQKHKNNAELSGTSHIDLITRLDDEQRKKMEYLCGNNH